MSNGVVPFPQPEFQRDALTIQTTPTMAGTAARVIAGLNVFMLLAGFILGIRSAAPQVIQDWLWIIAFRSLNSIAYSVLAVLIIYRHPRHGVGWLFLVVGFCLALAGLQEGLTALAIALPIHSSRVRGLITMVGHLAWAPWLLIPISLVLQFFPDGRLLSRRWWPVTAITILALAGFEVSQAFYPSLPEWRGVLGANNPLAIAGTEGFFPWLFQLSTSIFALAVLGSWAEVGVRFYRSRGMERMQMKWLVYSAGVAFLFLAFITQSDSSNPIVIFLTRGNPYDPPVLFIATILLPIGLGIAILRHHLFDIDIIISRTLVYGGLSLGIVAIYVLAVGALGTMFQAQGSYVIALLATGLIAVLFQPVRDQLQRRVNRLLYGERDDPAAVLTRLAHQVEAAETPTALLPNLVQTIAHMLKIPYVAIWLPVAAGQMEPVAVWGEAPEHVQTIPLTYQKETIGHLVVAPRGQQEQFNRQEQELLATIAALSATTVRAVQLSDELRRSRRRIVTAREDERRRMRRDLHDGLGPQLASQMLGLEAVAQTMPANPEKAQALLNSLKKQAQEAILDVRRLVYDLRPPALDDLGLIGALRQSVSRYETNVLRFNLDVPGTLPELPAAIETAAYRIAQEAMTNVVRHAQATLCTVRLFCTDAYVIVEVRDNGRGLSPSHHSGVGLQAMKERTAELNGQYVLEALPGGGTLVQARLPLEVYGE